MKNAIIIGAAALLIGAVIWLIFVTPGIAPTQPAQEQPTPQPTPNEIGSEDEITLRSSLTAQPWRWERTIMNDGTTITPRDPAEFGLTFAADGTMSGRTDCNNFSTTFTIDDPNNMRISFGEFASTLMACEGSQEAEFTDAIRNSNSFFFDDAGNLVLLIDFDSGSVIFSPEVSPEV